MSGKKAATYARALPAEPPPEAGRDDMSEAFLLGALMRRLDLFDGVARIVTADAFRFPGHVQMFVALAGYRAHNPAATAVTPAEVEARLYEANALSTCGAGYALEIAQSAALAVDVEPLARRVRRNAEIRRAKRALETALECITAGDVDRAGEVAGAALARIADLEPRTPVAPIVPLAAWACELGVRGGHLPTGLPTLDASTRGGPRVGDLVVIGGAPGSGKTTLLCNLAQHYGAGGAWVGLLASDEDAKGLATRIGQNLGFSREALEGADPAARAELEARLAEDLGSVLLGDAERGHRLEDMAAALRERAGDGPAVLLVDSIQTIPALGTDAATSPRERVDAVVAALKRAARSGLLVVATCELARGAYRTSDPTQRTEDLAAFKESGGIEYGVALALVLRSVPDSPDLVDVSIPKNRLRGPGAEDAFRLCLDRDHACFSEGRRPDMLSAEAVRENRAAARDAVLRARVLDAVRANPTLASLNAVARKVGKGNRAAILDAIHGLVEDGALAMVAGAFRVTPKGGSAGVENRAGTSSGAGREGGSEPVPGGSGTELEPVPNQFQVVLEPGRSEGGSSPVPPFGGTEGTRNRAGTGTASPEPRLLAPWERKDGAT